MTQRAGEVYIGTSGWSYNHWKGVFYPTDLAGAQMLEEYANHFRSTEINSSFYKLPSRNTLEQWRKSVPADFVFSAKASRYITHMKKLKDPGENVPVFLDRIKILGDKLGPVLFQLPPRWRCNRERLAVFLDSLPTGFRFAFEFRDHSWLNNQTYELLANHNAAFCIYELNGFLSPRQITADFVYVRLHGPDGPYQGSYDSASLAGWSRTFSTWSAQGKSIYCYFDNDQKGYAPENGQCLRNMVNG
ncbi:MAG: DUF72 domain-containing protein [Desulfuromonadales bacterium]|nr:DUF72 domain-containing protein [Desulfuromonadales bacterium]